MCVVAQMTKPITSLDSSTYIDPLTSEGTCRIDSVVASGSFHPDHYRMRAGVMCYDFMFIRAPLHQGHRSRLLKITPSGLHLELVNLTNKGPTENSNLVFDKEILEKSDIVEADIYDEDSVEFICSFLTQGECSRWKDCCNSAVHCCENQLETRKAQQGGSWTSGRACQDTWDGFSCARGVMPGMRSEIGCPAFVSGFLPTRQAYKTCTEHGNWSFWTNYTQCVDKESYLLSVYIGLTTSSISVLLLVPAIICFCTYKDLLGQARIKVHLCFFISLLLASLVNIVWNLSVQYDLLANPVKSLTAHYRNPVWCRVLASVKLYTTSSTYLWMFGEGFYLHRLLTKTFEPPRTIRNLYVICWGACDPTLNFVIFLCWTASSLSFLWLIYLPNLICLLVNFAFLCNILRILIFRLHSHPQEPSNYRRGLKATFMLIPLFGLQLFVTLYRPPSGTEAEKIVDCLLSFVTGSQGLSVALIFCFFNAEVSTRVKFSCQSLLRGGASRRQYHPSRHSPLSRTQSVQMTQFSPADGGRSPSNTLLSKNTQTGHLLFVADTPEHQCSLSRASTPMSFISAHGGSSWTNEQLDNKSEACSLLPINDQRWASSTQSLYSRNSIGGAITFTPPSPSISVKSDEKKSITHNDLSDNNLELYAG